MSRFAVHDLQIRAATYADIPALERLITASARVLGEGFYSDRETEAAIAHVFGVDSALIDDQTYFIAQDSAGHILGCGGWSRRRTLFGSDRFAEREPGLLSPHEDDARIRAFFVAPDAARRGVASQLLAACEGRAAAAGFTRAALMATLAGVPFYAAHGYVAYDPIVQQCGEAMLRFVPMRRRLDRGHSVSSAGSRSAAQSSAARAWVDPVGGVGVQ